MSAGLRPPPAAPHGSKSNEWRHSHLIKSASVAEQQTLHGSKLWVIAVYLARESIARALANQVSASLQEQSDKCSDRCGVSMRCQGFLRLCFCTLLLGLVYLCGSFSNHLAELLSRGEGVQFVLAVVLICINAQEKSSWFDGLLLHHWGRIDLMQRYCSPGTKVESPTWDSQPPNQYQYSFKI